MALHTDPEQGGRWAGITRSPAESYVIAADRTEGPKSVLDGYLEQFHEISGSYYAAIKQTGPIGIGNVRFEQLKDVIPMNVIDLAIALDNRKLRLKKADFIKSIQIAAEGIQNHPEEPRKTAIAVFDFILSKVQGVRENLPDEAILAIRILKDTIRTIPLYEEETNVEVTRATTELGYNAQKKWVSELDFSKQIEMQIA